MAIVGLIAAAGKATRMGGLPKFALPVFGGTLIEAVIHDMVAAGAEQIYVGSNQDNMSLMKRIVPDGTTVYLANTSTMNETVRLAQRWIQPNDITLFGMGDIYQTEPVAYPKLAVQVAGAEAALGVWAVEEPRRANFGVVAIREGRITEISDKNKKRLSQWCWGAMAWRGAFWDYIRPEQSHVGYSAQAFVEAGGVLPAVKMLGQIWNCNEPRDYWEAAGQFSRWVER